MDPRTEFAILNHLSTGHCVLSGDGTVRFWNHTLEVWTGRPAHQVEGHLILEVFPNLQQPRLKQRLLQSLANGTPTVFSHHIAPQFFPGVRLSGTERIQSTAMDVIAPDAEGQRRMLITVTEVTDQVQREDRVKAAKALAEEEVRQRKASEERFRVLVELTSDAIFVADTQGRIADCNSAAGLLFLKAWDEFEGTDLRSLFPSQHGALLQRLLEGADAERADLACIRADGTSFPAELSARWFQTGFQRHIVAYIHDLTLQKKAEEALRKANEALENLSFTDPLTGLRNRRFFEAYIRGDADKSIRAHRDKDPKPRKEIVFLIVDLDHFKRVNDTYGHPAGDAVLQQLAGILTSAMRQTDLVVRWGGEEFLLVARDACREDAARIAERVRRGVERHLFDLGTGEVLRLTCSIGYAIFPLVPEAPESHPVEDVIALADHALYATKRSGRNGWVGLESLPALPPDIRRDELLGGIPEFIEAGALKLSTSLGDVTWG